MCAGRTLVKPALTHLHPSYTASPLDLEGVTTKAAAKGGSVWWGRDAEVGPKQPQTLSPNESGADKTNKTCNRRGLSAMRPVQISRRNEVDRRAETDGEIVMVEAVGPAPRNATVVEADHLTPQRGHADEAGHRIGTEPPGETRRKSRGVEATGYAPRSATPVEGDLIRKQIEAAGVAPERLTIRRLGAARTVLGNTSLIVNSQPGLWP
jgi:hypothetical protein